MGGKPKQPTPPQSEGEDEADHAPSSDDSDNSVEDSDEGCLDTEVFEPGMLLLVAHGPKMKVDGKTVLCGYAAKVKKVMDNGSVKIQWKHPFSKKKKFSTVKKERVRHIDQKLYDS